MVYGRPELCSVFITHTLPDNSILSNKSKTFSIVWEDNTDSICDLFLLMTYLDNHPTKRYRTDTTRSPTNGGRARRSSNGTVDPSSLPYSSPLPHHPFPPNNDPTPTEGLLRSFTPVRTTSSTWLLGQVRSFSLVTCSTQIVSLSSSTFGLLELCPKTKL